MRRSLKPFSAPPQRHIYLPRLSLDQPLLRQLLFHLREHRVLDVPADAAVEYQIMVNSFPLLDASHAGHLIIVSDAVHVDERYPLTGLYLVNGRKSALLISSADLEPPLHGRSAILKSELGSVTVGRCYRHFDALLRYLNVLEAENNGTDQSDRDRN